MDEDTSGAGMDGPISSKKIQLGGCEERGDAEGTRGRRHGGGR